MAPDCSKCYDYEERLAIIEYDGCINADEAARLARREVCVGCLGRRGLDLLDLVRTTELVNHIAG